MSTQVDLSSYVSKDGSFALNVDSNYPLENLYNSDERFQVRSDADDQLIVHFAFNEKVRLTGFSIQAPTDAMRPEKIKLFLNQVSIDFADTDTIPAAFEADLEPEDVAGDKVLPLRVVKFNSVDSITLFVESSDGGDVSALASVKFFGNTVQGTNMNELKKTG